MKTDKKDLPVNVRINMYRWSHEELGLMQAEPNALLIGKLDSKGEPRDIPGVVEKMVVHGIGVAAATWTCDGVTYWYSEEGGLRERPVGYIQADPWL